MWLHADSLKTLSFHGTAAVYVHVRYNVCVLQLFGKVIYGTHCLYFYIQRTVFILNVCIIHETQRIKILLRDLLLLFLVLRLNLYLVWRVKMADQTVNRRGIFPTKTRRASNVSAFYFDIQGTFSYIFVFTDCLKSQSLMLCLFVLFFFFYQSTVLFGAASGEKSIK